MIAHPTPESRDRMYVVFWRRGNCPPQLDFRPTAWCPTHGDVEAIQSWKIPTRPFGKYRQHYVYCCPTCAAVAVPYAWPAASAIDWRLEAPRIGDRAKPLAKTTMERIAPGSSATAQPRSCRPPATPSSARTTTGRGRSGSRSRQQAIDSLKPASEVGA